MSGPVDVAALIAERNRLRALCAACYAGLVAECGLPDQWADAFLAGAQGEAFSVDGLLPFTTAKSDASELVEALRDLVHGHDLVLSGDDALDDAYADMHTESALAVARDILARQTGAQL